MLKSFHRPQRFARMRADAPGLGSVKPAHNPISVQQVLGGDGVVLTRPRPVRLADVERVHQRPLAVGKKLIARAQAGLEPSVALRRINAHRAHLDPCSLELSVILLQLAELHDTERSPIPLVEEHQDRSLAQNGGQRHRPILGIRQGEIGKAVTDLQPADALLAPEH